MSEIFKEIFNMVRERSVQNANTDRCAMCTSSDTSTIIDYSLDAYEMFTWLTRGCLLGD